MKKFQNFLLEYKKEDVDLIKSISDYFTLAVEYEICSTESPEEEPFADFPSIKKIKEQTLLDLSRGAPNYDIESKFPESFFINNENQMILENPNFNKLSNKKKTTLHRKYLTKSWLDNLMDEFSYFLENNWDDEDEVEEYFNYKNFIGYDSKLNKKVIKLVVTCYYENVCKYGYDQNFSYVLKQYKKHLPNFYKKWNKTFKYELESDIEKSRILEFSPKTYIEGIDKLLEQLDDFYNDFEKQDYWIFNERTALHINVGVKNRDLVWNPIKGLLMMSDMNRDKKVPFVFKGIMHRLNNMFCSSLLDEIKSKLSTTSKERNYLLDNINKLDIHNLKEFEDFFNPFLIKANNDFYIKNFGIKITEIENGYVEFRFIGGDIDIETIKDKLLYYCYIVYLMTNDYRKEDYHKRLYKFVEDVKSLISKAD